MGPASPFFPIRFTILTKTERERGGGGECVCDYKKKYLPYKT